MFKNKVKLFITVVSLTWVIFSLSACGTNNATSTTPRTTTAESSQEDIDSIVEKKVQEQLEINHRVKESVKATIKEAPKNEGTYILPFSNERLATNADLATLSKDQLRLARNEIFARHGRIYETKDLNDYFSSQGWYTPTTPADQWNDSVFSDIESMNVQQIASYEKSGTVEAISNIPLPAGTYSYSWDSSTYQYIIGPDQGEDNSRDCHTLGMINGQTIEGSVQAFCLWYGDAKDTYEIWTVDHADMIDKVEATSNGIKSLFDDSMYTYISSNTEVKNPQEYTSSQRQSSQTETKSSAPNYEKNANGGYKTYSFKAGGSFGGRTKLSNGNYLYSSINVMKGNTDIECPVSTNSMYGTVVASGVYYDKTSGHYFASNVTYDPSNGGTLYFSN